MTESQQHVMQGYLRIKDAATSELPCMSSPQLRLADLPLGLSLSLSPLAHALYHLVYTLMHV